LKNKFEIIAAVKNERSRIRATGKILGVEDYAFTKEKLQLCTENDCLITVELYVNTHKKDIMYI